MLRIVLDANVIVSAVISPKGKAAEILNLWQLDAFELLISPAIFSEVSRVLHYPKIKEKYRLAEEQISQVLTLLTMAEIIEPQEQLSIIEKDPSDNRYLECASSGGAANIVTGDIHLLELKEYQGIVILSPASFLELLKCDPHLID